MASALEHIELREIENAIRKGLQQGNPNMVRVVEELREKDESLEILKNLDIDIVPFSVPDESLYNIVLRAPEYVIDEIMAGLRERKRLAEFGGEELQDG